MILVTGASGRTGSGLVEELAGMGAPVRALVRSPERAAPLQRPGVEVAVGDFAEPETLNRALDGVERVFLLSSVDLRQVELQDAMADAAARAGVRHVVKMSALGAAEDSPVALLRWHRETERRIEDSGVGWTHLRPNSFMQNLVHIGPLIARDGILPAPLGEGAVSLVDVRDVSAVAAGVLTGEGHEGRAYDVTGPEALTYAEVAARIGAASGREVRYVETTLEQSRAGMVAAGMPEWFADSMAALNATFREGAGARVSGVVREVTGREARSFDSFVAEHREAFGAGVAA